MREFNGSTVWEFHGPAVYAFGGSDPAELSNRRTAEPVSYLGPNNRGKNMMISGK
jgi:hypothetical protein